MYTPIRTLNNNNFSVRRGEIHWVEKRNVAGSEMDKGRPALIVSNNIGNEHSGCVEVVFLTGKPKTTQPTHVVIQKTSNGRAEGSTILCEQITTISKERFQDESYMCRLSDEDMEEVEKALMVSLGLDEYIERTDMNEEPDYDNDDIEYGDDTADEEMMAMEEELRHAKMEAEFYKKQYEALMDRIMSARF